MKIKSGKQTIEISNSDKILFGKSGITKLDLVQYYKKIAPIMIKYCKNRPISMQRFPHGINETGFFQKNAGDYFPAWITEVTIAKQDGTKVNYVVINNPATLIYLANQNCITPHIWLSTIDNLKKPNRLIFDLDPSKNLTFARVQSVAKKLKKLLDSLTIPTFCMLTGSRGAHIVIPLKRIHTFEETRTFAYAIALQLAQEFPDLITVEVHKNKRKNRIFIDWLRNGFGATAVAPYAVRAYDNAPIAMPVTWDELLSPRMNSKKYTLKNSFARLLHVGDIWHDIQKHAVSLKTQIRNFL